MGDDGEFARFVLRKARNDGTLVLPTKLLKSEVLQKFEEKLRTGIPVRLSNFYKNYEILDIASIDAAYADFSNPKEPNADDTKVIEFFSRNRGSSFDKLLGISGELIFLGDVIDDISKHKDITENIRVCVFLWAYLSMYELILDLMTSDLKVLLSEKNKSNKNTETTLRLIEKKLKEGEHLTAGKIESILIQEGVLLPKHDSIFHHSRIFRNSVGHANLFYDSPTEKLFDKKGGSYSLVEFKEEFNTLKTFLFQWAYVLNNRNLDVGKTIKGILSGLSRELLVIERSGDYKRAYNNVIFNLKKEYRTRNTVPKR